MLGFFHYFYFQRHSIQLLLSEELRAVNICNISKKEKADFWQECHGRLLFLGPFGQGYISYALTCFCVCCHIE